MSKSNFKNRVLNDKSEDNLNLLKIEYLAKEKVTGFFDFIRTQGVIGLAIGFMLGDKIKNLVNSFVTDILNPFLVMASGSVGSLTDAKIQIFGAEVMWGRFTSTFIDFLIMAAIIYFIFKGLGLDKLDKPKEN
jgi:large conductance mechanosensitive channel